MDSGWIKTYRKTLDNPIVCKDAEHLAVWMYLLWTATHTEMNSFFGGKRIILQPGQLITGRKKISEKLKISESKVQRILKTFENEQQIEQQTTNVNRLISIINWKEYQITEQQLNNNRTTSEQRVNTIQECKKEKNVKNINIAFDEFWNLYDKKRGDKEKLKIKWEKLSDDDRKEIINYIPLYIQSQPEKKYRKDPSTFLNNKSWKDELISNTNNSNNQNNGNKQSNKSEYRNGISIIKEDFDYANDPL